MVLRTGVYSLWKAGLLVDYTIEVDGHEFHVHKAVLASVSGYFKEFLSNGKLESKQDRLKLQGFTYLAMQNMIDFIYEKKFGDPKASAKELFSLATYLQIRPAITICTTELCKGLKPENCMHMFNLFMTHHVKDGIKQVTTYIKSNIDAVLGMHKVVHLPIQLLSQLHDCFGRSEWDLFCTLKEWVYADFENRKQYVKGLMINVRFPLMTPSQLGELKKQDIYSQCPGTWHGLIEKATSYHRMPTHKKVLDRSSQTHVRSNPSPVCFPVNDKNDFHVLHNKNWEEHEGLLAPRFKGRVFALVVNNFLIAYNQSSVYPGMYIFDPRTLMWSEMASVPPRDDFALVHHGEHLYALGGRVQTNLVKDIIIYKFNTNSWEHMTLNLPHPVHKHAACVLQNQIFISGGKGTVEGQDTNEMHCLDLSTKTCTTKAPMLQANSGHQLVRLPDRRTMIVLTGDLKLQMYRCSTSQWTLASLLKRPRAPLKLNANSAVISGGNFLWLLNVTLEVNPTQVNWMVNEEGLVYPNQHNEHGLCVKVLLKNRDCVTVPDRFPLYVAGADGNDNNEKRYFTAMLSVPLHTCKARVGPRP